jgi:hypothetical protein
MLLTWLPKSGNKPINKNGVKRPHFFNQLEISLIPIVVCALLQSPEFASQQAELPLPDL